MTWSAVEVESHVVSKGQSCDWLIALFECESSFFCVVVHGKVVSLQKYMQLIIS